MRSQGRLIIQGCLVGTLEADTVIVGEQGRVQAEAHVNRLAIHGSFEGQLKVRDELTIHAGGRCSGTVSCRSFVVEAGGILNAEINCTQPQAADQAPVATSPAARRES